MALVLLIAEDAVSAAALEDGLHLRGHQCRRSTIEGLSDRNDDGRLYDLVIVDLDGSIQSGIATIERLRRRSSTRTAPVMVIVDFQRSEDRLELFRAGADELLPKPFSVDEAVLRAGRLAGVEAVGKGVMVGDLGQQSLWQLLQYLEQMADNGALLVRGRNSSGRIELEHGLVTSARWNDLRNTDALLAIHDSHNARFRIVSSRDVSDHAQPPESLPIPRIALTAAWLHDELELRKEHLPTTGAALRVVGPEPPAANRGDKSLPLAEVYARIREQPGICLFDLLAETTQAPQRIRLAVCWLIEQELVKWDERTSQEIVPTTTQLLSLQSVELAALDLVNSIRATGFEHSVVPVLVLNEQALAAHLESLISVVATSSPDGDTWRRLADRTARGLGGSAVIETEEGKLAVHFRDIERIPSFRLESVLEIFRGVVLWLDQLINEEPLQRLLEGLGTLEKVVPIAVVTPGDEIRKRVVALGPSSAASWRFSTHAPQTLLGLLRLLEAE